MNKKPHFRGQSLAEFALTLPFLLLILMMIFDLGRAVYYFSAINHAAHEGVRYGSVSYEKGQEDLIEARVREAATGIGDAIQFGSDSPCVAFDTYDRAHLKVDIQYFFEPVTPLVATFVGNGQTVGLDVDSTMMIEYYIPQGDTNQYTPCSP